MKNFSIKSGINNAETVIRFLLRWAKFNDCRGWKKCEKVRKNAKKREKFGKNTKNRALFAKNSIALVNFVYFLRHFHVIKRCHVCCFFETYPLRV